jgi:hypothetical protein
MSNGLQSFIQKLRLSQEYTAVEGSLGLTEIQSEVLKGFVAVVGFGGKRSNLLWPMSPRGGKSGVWEGKVKGLRSVVARDKQDRNRIQRLGSSMDIQGEGRPRGERDLGELRGGVSHLTGIESIKSSLSVESSRNEANRKEHNHQEGDGWPRPSLVLRLRRGMRRLGGHATENNTQRDNGVVLPKAKQKIRRADVNGVFEFVTFICVLQESIKDYQLGSHEKNRSSTKNRSTDRHVFFAKRRK